MADVRTGNVTDVAFQLGKESIAIAFLDFCDFVDEQMAVTVARVSRRCVQANGVMAVGFMRGREQKATTQKREAMIELTDHLAKARSEEFTAFMNSRRMSVREDPKLKLDGRSSLLWNMVVGASLVSGWNHLPVGEIRYHSATVERSGVPMAYSLSLTRDPAEGHLFRKEMIERGAPVILQIRNTPEECENRLRWSVVNTAKQRGVWYASRLFDVPERTVIAWKALATRGTFGDDPMNEEKAKHVNEWVEH